MAVLEFNPVLALRNHDEYQSGRRKVEECFPESPETGKIYPFLKHGQRSFWMSGEVPVVETNGKEISRPLGSVQILETTQFLDNGQINTRGLYKFVEIFSDKDVHFDALEKINSSSWTSKLKNLIS